LLFQGVRAQFDAIKGDSAAVRITPHLSPTANLDILAIAAPKIESFTASSYDPDTFNDLYQTARHAFQGVKAQYPGTPLEIETGLWGAGAFHNSKYLAVAIQYLAARASGIEGIHFKFNLPGISDNNVYVQSICATVDAFISTHQGKIALILPALAAKAKELESH
jgi:hypothetical protein